MNTDRTGFYTCKECHQTESLWNRITTDHKEGEQLEDRRNVCESSSNSGDGTDQRVQSLMFMMMTSNVAKQMACIPQFSNRVFRNKLHDCNYCRLLLSKLLSVFLRNYLHWIQYKISLGIDIAQRLIYFENDKPWLLGEGARCWWRSWLRHCATSRKVSGSIPDVVIGIFSLT